MTQLLQVLFYGLMLGFVYGVIAIGFVVVYKGSGVFNLAQGEMLMLGAFLCYSLYAYLHFPFFLAVVATLVISVGLGFVIERTFLRPLLGQPHLAVVMMTIGLGIMIKGIISLIWSFHNFRFPSYLPQGSLSIGIFSFSWDYVAGSVVAICMLLGFIAYFKWSKAGLSMRATADDQYASASLGVNINSVFGLSWGISILAASLAGIVLATFTSINVDLGTYGLLILPALVLGGFDSLPGAIIGGLVVGIVEKLTQAYLPELMGFAAVSPYLIVLLVLMLRPYGLFGMRRIERI